MKNLILNNKSILIAAAMLASLSGCALTPATVQLDYKPTPGMAKIQGANKVTVGVRVNDDRKDKVLGNKVNGYNMKMAGISAKEDVAITLKNALTDGLLAKGFNVSNNSTANVTVVITKFYADIRYLRTVLTSSSDYDSSLNAKVNFSTLDGSVLFTKELTATGYSSKFLDSGDGSVESASNKALANAVNQLLDNKDFIEALLSTAEPTTEVVQPATPMVTTPKPATQN